MREAFLFHPGQCVPVRIGHTELESLIASLRVPDDQIFGSSETSAVAAPRGAAIRWPTP